MSSRITSDIPINFRLLQRVFSHPQDPVLQGYFAWYELDANGGVSGHGGDWRDLPTMIEDGEGGPYPAPGFQQ